MKTKYLSEETLSLSFYSSWYFRVKDGDEEIPQTDVKKAYTSIRLMSAIYKKSDGPEKETPSMVGLFSSGKCFLTWKIAW